MKYLYLLSFVLLAWTPAWADDSFLLRILSPINEIPREISDQDKDFPFRKGGEPFEVQFTLLNDSVFPPPGSSDNGYTHGLRITATKSLENGIRFTGHYSTDLYTAAVENGPDPRDQKYFTNDNMIRFIADNELQGRAWYWRAETGWQQLSDDPHCNVFEGSCQQIWFHSILRHLKNVSAPVDIPDSRYLDGHGRQNGAIFGGALGRQQRREFGPVILSASEEAGGRAGTLAGTSSAYTRFDADLSHTFKSGRNIRAGLEFQAKAHPLGVEYNPGAWARFQGKHIVFDVERYNTYGQAQNYVLYNLRSPNGRYDPITTVTLSYRLHRKE